MTEKEISFDEALKLPKGVRIRGKSTVGMNFEGVTGGDYYNDRQHVGFIRDDGTHDGFNKAYFPTIVVLGAVPAEIAEPVKECSNDLCPDCSAKLEWVAMALKCPKCWKVV